ncbi:MAG: stage III sporulation protein AC [Ruminiclostridium sp.]|nr:stage III sporulation protein AC [Ruminiclostridium sp.]
MDIDLIFRIAGVGIIVAVLDILLKKSGKDEQAMMTTIAGLVVVLMILIGEIGMLFDTIRDVFGI